MFMSHLNKLVHILILLICLQTAFQGSNLVNQLHAPDYASVINHNGGKEKVKV